MDKKPQQTSHRRENKLYIVTHGELKPGYQIPQVAHAVAEFAISHPELFKKWHNISQYIIALQTNKSNDLETLYEKAKALSLTVLPFYEPDLNNQLTALSFAPNSEVPSLLANLQLAGKPTK